MASPPNALYVQSSSSLSSHRRRPSLQMPTTTSPRAIPIVSPRAAPIPIASPRAVPLPVPQRHGSISIGSYSSVSDFTSLASPRMRAGHRGSGSFSGGSASLSNSFVLGPAITDDSDSWLDTPATEVAKDTVKVMSGDTGLEHATETLMNEAPSCLLVQRGNSYGLFDFADLNTVLLLVLIAALPEAPSALDDRAREIVVCLKKKIRLGVGMVCDISQKNPCTPFPPDTPLRRILPLFASGVHRVVITSDPPRILEAATLLAFFTRRPPSLFRLSFSEVDLPLHPLVSLPAAASVLDAMQVMSLNGLSALGVVTGNPEQDSELRSLVGVVTAADCSKLVVPSEGKQVLGMGLGDMCKNVLVDHHDGRERGEERVPVHTITPSTTLLHAASLILATSSSRVVMRTPPSASPPLSPASSFDQLSPPASPALDPISLGLPTPPSTQLSPQYVISILDLMGCLARTHHSKLLPFEPIDDTETWDMIPDNMGKRRRRASSSAAATGGFESWRWADDPSPF